MDLEEMKKIWKRQQVQEEQLMTNEQLVLLLNNKLIKLDEQLKRRDWWEIALAAITAIVCVIILINTSSIWYQLGSLTLIGASILITYKLQRARSEARSENVHANRSLKEHLQDELQKITAQVKLLKSVLWWYLLPIFVGLLFFVIGFELELWIKAIYLLIAILVYAFIWRMNQQAAKERFSPIVKDLEEAIAFINQDKG